MPKKIPEQKREEIWHALQEGKSYLAIQGEFSVTPASISAIRKEHQKADPIELKALSDKAEAGKDLYAIFAAHADSIAELLSTEEQLKMNTIGDVLENA